MAGKSDYMENKVLDIIGGTTFSAPATIYVALYTAAPTDAGGGTEVSGGSYARVAVTNNATNWPAASAGAKSNGTDIVFPAPTANWGTIVAFALFDAAAGNMLYWGLVTPNKTVNNGDPAPKFAVGALSLTED
jgi:hypothetical protein